MIGSFVGAPIGGIIQQDSGIPAVEINTMPTLGAPALGQDHELTTAGLTASPTVATPILVVSHGLLAQGIILQPTIGRPAISNHFSRNTEITSTRALDLGVILRS